MVEKQSMAQELLECLQTRKRIPNYLSPSDAVSMADYARSAFASRYVLDTRNVYWPGRVNRTHVYDAFAEFMHHKDSCKTRLDMINFVADNKERYSIDCHIVLKMHEMNLNAWACKMSYCENGADELALHALSELAKIHTVVLTASRPWTTVDLTGLRMDLYQLIDMCSMKLLYLGNNQFGLLRRRPENCNNPLALSRPVFPTVEEPNAQELETANTLLMMTQGNQSQDSELPLQEPSMSLQLEDNSC